MTVIILGPGAKPRRVFPGVVLFAVLLALPITVAGQGYFGTVSGVLTDSSEAVVPGAHVTLTDQAKGYVFTTTSDSTGRYLFTAIPPGLYSVSAQAQGFEKAALTNIKVNVTENAVANLTLQVAGTKQTIQVEAQRQTVETEDAVTGQVVNRRFINDLPLVDRYVLDFVALAPGINNADLSE
jgi:hypothetical protein